MAGVREVRADAVTAIAVLLLGSFLFLSGLGLLAQWEVSAARRQSLSVDDLLGAVAVATGLAIVAWWALSLTLAIAAAVLARRGRLQAAEQASKYCPAFMRRLALAALSVQLLAAPMAQAAVPPGGPAWVPAQEVAVQARWSPTPLLAVEDAATHGLSAPNPPATNASNAAVADVPHLAADVPDAPGSIHATNTPSMETGATARPAPNAAAAPAPPPTIRPHWQPSAPVPDPGLLASQSFRAAQEAPPARQTVTVLAGDTLWEIAARHLGPSASDVEVALHWPRWYEANKAQIGESPHVLLPGQILKAPATT